MRLAKELKVSEVYIGKHGDADKPFVDKNIRFRSMRSYVKSNLPSKVKCCIVK